MKSRRVLLQWFFVVIVGFALPSTILYSTNESFKLYKTTVLRNLNTSKATVFLNRAALQEFINEKHKIFEDIKFGQNIPKKILFSHYLVTVRFPRINGNIEVVSGTAVAIRPRKLITCAHIAQGSAISIDEKKEVRLHLFSTDGVEQGTVVAKIEKVDKDLDLAVLTITSDLFYYINAKEFSKLPKIEIGDPIYGVGATAGTTPCNIKWGNLVNFTNRFEKTLWHGTLAVQGGDSGGGVFSTKDDKFIGITSCSLPGGNLFIPLEKIKKFLDIP